MTTDNSFQLPSTDDAAAVLDGIYADVFFSKMAEFGLVPETQDGALSMLETAAYLDQADTAVKQAGVDPFVNANELLKQALAQENIIDSGAQVRTAVKQAAVGLASNPEIYKAVLAIKTAAAR